MRFPTQKPKDPSLCDECQLSPPEVGLVDFYEAHNVCEPCAERIRRSWQIKEDIRKEHELRRKLINKH